MTKFHAEFPNLCRIWKQVNRPLVQNIELRLPVNSNWTIWIFYSFTTGECSVRSPVFVSRCTVIINENLTWI